MEITALIEALSAMKKTGQKVRVFSDSSYVVSCIREKWYENWQRNGWLTAAKKPVENRDLWEKLLPLLTKQDATYYLVKGHIGAKASEETKQKGYARFVKNNGGKLTYEEYLYATAKNNRADELARQGAEAAK
jgi:ribonuclease HI